MLSSIGNAVVQAAKTGIRTVVNFAYSDAQQKQQEKVVKLDGLKRAAYENDLPTLFEGKWPTSPDTREKLLMPDMTIRQVIDKFATNIFIKGTAFSGADEKKTALIQSIISDTNLGEKLFNITVEASLMGYVGLRSVWHNDLNHWLIEIKPKEQIRLETEPLNPENVTAIIIQYQYWNADKKLVWYRERWTKEDYQLWAPIEVGGLSPQLKEPEWEKKPFTTEVNTFGEIPITLVPHQYDPKNIGKGVVRRDDVDLAKALVRLKNKRHYAHLEHMDPSVTVLNGSEDDDIERGVGSVIRVNANSKELAPTVQLLEMSTLPESVKEELQEHVYNFYKNAGLTPPSVEENLKTATPSSAVALRVKDTGESKTMDALRDDGYSRVRLHIEKLLRMGALTRKSPEYASAGINPADEESYKVVVQYPPFFPPTPDEQQTLLQTLRSSHLSAEERAKREAEAFQIEDQAEIQEIQANIETEDEMKLLAPTSTSMLNNARQNMPPAAKPKPAPGGKPKK